MRPTYTYKVTGVRVVDGDTIEADVDVGFGVVLHKQMFRLFGINAYETRRGSWTKQLPQSVVEMRLKLGKMAKDCLIHMVEQAEMCTIATVPSINKGKYGRWLAVLYVDNLDWNNHVIEQGWGVEAFY